MNSEEAEAGKAGIPAPEPSLNHSLSLDLKVEGMWCPACSWLIEEVLRKTRGAVESRVHFLSDLVRVKYLPHLLSPQEIMERISGLGYRPSPIGERSEASAEKKDLLKRLGISSILAANIMMISMALYLGFFEELSAAAIQALSWPLWAMATPVVFYGGWTILKRGLAGIRHGHPSMESLISLGALAAYFYSLVRMLAGSLHLYFDTAAMLITLVLLGKYIETLAREKVSGGILDLYRLGGQKVRLGDGAGEHRQAGGKERWISSKEAKPGDEFLVLDGERVPLDGRVISGRGNVDESVLTGESRPVRKGPGDEILGGVLFSGEKLLVKATRVGRESSLGQIIALTEEALKGKTPSQLLADHITRWFVPSILVLAAAVGFSLWILGSPPDEAILRSLTVLVISCPCALGIATPLAVKAGIGLSQGKGILIREPGAFERARNLDTLVFDKTGTLTEGRFSLREVAAEDASKEEVLTRLASLEFHSDHFLAKEIVRRAEELSLAMEEISSFEEFQGMGVTGLHGAREVFAGNRRLLSRLGIELPPTLEEKAGMAEAKGSTVVFFGWDRRVRGFLVFGDSLKKRVPEMVQELRSRGFSTWIISGDSPETTQAIAQESGITHFQGHALPRDKVALIKALQEKGRRVGMVGDGINDAAALAQADVGFALGTGSNILREASDLSFLSSDPRRVLEALDLSLLTVRVIRQNLFFSFLYNSFGIPVAAAGLLNPLIAVLAMFASSLTVIGNALRITPKGRVS